MAGEGEEDPDRKVYVTGTKTLSDDEVQWIFSHYGTVSPTLRGTYLLFGYEGNSGDVAGN